ncbi:MAG: hypothetical protein HY438_02530 [DPANN group archaeon]|nr:hypothetical protein [DPANN group archaeon]
MVTTIQIHNETKVRLDAVKDFERETYEDVIAKLLDLLAEDQMELSEQTKREIEQARKDFGAGKFVTEAELKRRLGLK